MREATGTLCHCFPVDQVHVTFPTSPRLDDPTGPSGMVESSIPARGGFSAFVRRLTVVARAAP